MWYQDGVPLSGSRYSYNFSHGLTIDSIQPNDTGTYRCLVETGVGDSFMDIDVTVVMDPDDKSEPTTIIWHMYIF